MGPAWWAAMDFLAELTFAGLKQSEGAQVSTSLFETGLCLDDEFRSRASKRPAMCASPYGFGCRGIVPYQAFEPKSGLG